MSVSDEPVGLPRVSVVIPCYNRERYIQQAVDSVLLQDYPRVNLIVVDDGSTDGSLEILRGYGCKLQLLTHPGGINRGQSASINLGITNSESEYIAILDSDDWWSSDKLSSHVAFLETHPDTGLVYGNGYRVEESSGERYRMYDDRHQEHSNPARVLLDCYFALPGNAVIRRAAFERAGGFDESLRSAQDHDMAIRLAEVTRLAYLPGERFFYRRHAESISHRSHALRWRNGFYILEKAAARYPYDASVIRKRRAVLNFRMGQCLLAERRLLQAARFMFGAFSNDPRRALRVLAGREGVSSPSA